MMLFTDEDLDRSKPLRVCESEMAVSQGAIEVSRLVYCGALMLHQDGKNFAAHIYPEHDYHSAPEIAQVIIDHFKPPFALNFVLGSQDFGKDQSYDVIRNVVDILRGHGHAVELNKIGEMETASEDYDRRGEVRVGAQGKIEGLAMFPCILYDAQQPLEHNGMTYSFNRHALFKKTCIMQDGRIRVHDKKSGTQYFENAIAVLDPFCGEHKRPWISKGASVAIFVASPKKLG